MPGKLIFDIGANTGSWTTQNMSDTDHFVCVEANPNTFIKLKNNLYDYQNVEMLNMAVSSKTDKYLKFYASSHDVLSTTNRDWLYDPRSRFYLVDKNVEEVNVPTISLDKIIVLHGIPDLLKIDVEGAEEDVLLSLTSKVPCVCFEWAAEWRTENKNCIDRLVKLGFSKFNLQAEDNYVYRPKSYDYDANMIKAALDSAIDKVDWGMIWAI